MILMFKNMFNIFQNMIVKMKYINTFENNIKKILFNICITSKWKSCEQLVGNVVLVSGAATVGIVKNELT